MTIDLKRHLSSLNILICVTESVSVFDKFRLSIGFFVCYNLVTVILNCIINLSKTETDSATQ